MKAVFEKSYFGVQRVWKFHIPLENKMCVMQKFSNIQWKVPCVGSNSLQEQLEF